MLIPSIDLQGGRIVQLVQGERLAIETTDPEPWIAKFSGFPRVQLIDLDAAKGQGDNAAFVARICGRLPCRVGGGIRSVENMREMLLAGADKVGVNTSAVTNPGLVDAGAKAFGSQCIVVAIDAKREGPGKWGVYTHGGRTPVGLDAVEWAKEVWRRGAGEILLTSMDSDGTQAGYDIELTAAVSSAIGIPVIASGGAGNLDHMVDVLNAGKADAVLAASIFHFGMHTVGEAKRHFAERGVPVRPVVS